MGPGLPGRVREAVPQRGRPGRADVGRPRSS